MKWGVVPSLLIVTLVGFLGVWLFGLPPRDTRPDQMNLEPQPWSDPRTWGGSVPLPNADVTVAAGKRVVLDRDVIVKTLTVLGTLEFARKDLQLRAGWIMVMDGGRFVIGTPPAPFTQRATVTLTGADSGENIMEMGTKFLGAMSGGSLELFGEPRVSWTHLARTALPGETRLKLDGTPQWRPGDRLILTSSNLDMRQAETLTVTGVVARGVTVTPPLKFRHSGRLERIGGFTVDGRAEVALLNRNLKIQGDPASDRDGFGGQIMVMDRGTRARLSNIELERMGQTGKLKRYALHFHQTFDDGANSFIRDSSLHRNFNRCIVIHGVNHLLVEGNTCVDTLGHAFFLEDGAEVENRLIGNLGALTRAPKPELAVNPSDVEASTFWITNPRNTIRANVSAGADGYGFWFALPTSRIGVTGRIAPEEYKRLPFSQEWRFDFRDNTAHSSQIGLFQDGCVAGDFSTFPCYYGLAAEQKAKDLGFQPRPSDPRAVIDVTTGAFTAYRNRVGVQSRGLGLRFQDLRLLENLTGATLDCLGCELVGGLIAGRGASSSNPLEMPQTGYRFGEGPLRLRGVTFAGFEDLGNQAISFGSGFRAGGANTVAGLRFISTPGNNRISSGDASAATLRDLDGSLVGRPGALVAHVPGLIGEGCLPRAAWSVCPTDQGQYRFMEVFSSRDDNPILRVVTDGGVVSATPAGTPIAFDAARPFRLEFRNPPTPGTLLEFFGQQPGRSWRYTLPFARAPVSIGFAGHDLKLRVAPNPQAMTENSYFYDPRRSTLEIWQAPTLTDDLSSRGSVTLEIR